MVRKLNVDDGKQCFRPIRSTVLSGGLIEVAQNAHFLQDKCKMKNEEYKCICPFRLASPRENISFFVSFLHPSDQTNSAESIYLMILRYLWSHSKSSSNLRKLPKNVIFSQNFGHLIKNTHPQTPNNLNCTVMLFTTYLETRKRLLQTLEMIT